MTARLRAIVLAAGAGRRFGGPKQLAQVRGRPLIEHALALVAAWDPIVVLGARADAIRAGADLGGAEIVVAADWAEGQAASLRRGVAAAGDVDGVLVCLADQPGLTAAVLDGTVARFDPAACDAVRPRFAGIPGHPVLLGRAVLAGVPGLQGDAGARGLLAGARVCLWDADGLADPADVDTPDALRAFEP